MNNPTLLVIPVVILVLLLLNVRSTKRANDKRKIALSSMQRVATHLESSHSITGISFCDVYLSYNFSAVCEHDDTLSLIRQSFEYFDWTIKKHTQKGGISYFTASSGTKDFNFELVYVPSDRKIFYTLLYLR